VSISGYISLYNDWDILSPALHSVLPYLDELIVVDGAYSWMARFLEGIGRNPERSEPRVHEIIASLGVPVHYVSSIWNNELEKRLAGYRACRGDYVLRIDADEVLFFDDGALDRFLTSTYAVAEMEMPTYVAPGWIQAWSDRLPRQSFLFKRSEISAEDHLHYLWLVLTADELPGITARLPVFPEPIAFNAHLTMWRTPDTAIQRACFYTLNWSRKHGVPWIRELQNKPLEDVATLLKSVPAQAYFDIMLGNRIVSGNFELNGAMLRATPLTAEQEALLLPIYEAYHNAHTQQNLILLRQHRHIFSGHALFIDISHERSFSAVVKDGLVTLEASDTIGHATITLHSMTPSAPCAAALKLEPRIAKNVVSFEVPKDPPGEELVQKNLEISLWLGSSDPLQRLILR
jgi:hypothetical protein